MQYYYHYQFWQEKLQYYVSNQSKLKYFFVNTMCKLYLEEEWW
jgi:hypothetical protein